jgi:hypothetical protein
MIDVRTIRVEEAEEFLRVLCTVFDLDFDRARPVFFAEPFYDLNRKWALFESGKIVSVLTTVPLTFGWGQAIGIAGVGTLIEARGQGYGTRLLEGVLAGSRERNEGSAYLFARQTELYGSVGFEVIDAVVRGSLIAGQGFVDDPLSYDEVVNTYTRWSESAPNRLRRDEQRWGYWRWHLRLCDRFGSGYICREPGLIREVIPGSGPWPVRSDEEFLGLRSMAEKLNVPLANCDHETHVMAFGTSRKPEFFLTDQF